MVKPVTLKICEGRACKARFSEQTKARAENDIQTKKLTHITIESASCQGHCKTGPTVVFKDQTSETTLNDITPLKMGALIKKIS